MANNIINYDIKLDESGDLYINELTGDIEITDSNKELCNSLVQSTIADYKQNPDYYLNLDQELGGNNSRLRIDSKLRKLMQRDGFSITDLQIILLEENQLTIKTNATRNR